MRRLSVAVLFLAAAEAVAAQPIDTGLQYVQRLHMPSRADDIGYPRSVTADLHAGEIFVCDVRKNRIAIFDRDGLFLYMIPGGEIFRTPLDIALDPDGYILLLARQELELVLLRLDFDGKFIERITLSGLPRSVAEPDLVSIAMSPAGDRYYLLDEANLHVWITDRAGAVVGMIDMVGDLTEKEASEQIFGHVDVYGDTVLVAAATQGTVFLYDLEGNPKRWVGIRGTAPCQTMFPMAAALTEDGRAVIVDFQRMLITVWDVGANRCLGEYSGIGNRPGYVYQPEDLALDGAGRVYVSQGFEGRVQVWAGAGPAAGAGSDVPAEIPLAAAKP